MNGPDDRQRLRSLITRRAELAASLDARVAELESVQSRLRAMEGTVSAIDPTEVDDPAALAAARRSVAPLLSGIDGEIARIRLIQTRFRRGRINVGVLGQSGNGKSRFLRSLTGLDQEFIPDQNLGATTGVPSVVHHGEPVSATVKFLTEREYLERIGTYYEKMGLGPAPTSAAAFASAIIPAAPAHPEAMRHLVRLHKSSGEILPLLTGGRVAIQPSEIASYVTQEGAGGEARHRYTAVDRLELTAPYPFGLPEVGVVDLPGLGDTNLTDQKLVLTSVREDIDVLIMVVKPSQDRALWGTRGEELRTLALDALPGLPLEQRALLVLNLDQRPGASNRPQCERLKRDVDIPVGAIDIVDAASPDDVRDFFARMVARLADMADASDKALLQQATQAWGAQAQLVQAYVNDVSSLVAAAAGSNLSHNWRVGRVIEARQQLFRGLRDYADGLDKGPSRISEAIDKAYDDAMAKADAIASGFDQNSFDALRDDLKGSNTLAYLSALDEVRAGISSVFASLDNVFQDQMQQQKEELADVLISSGQFSHLVRGAGMQVWEGFLGLLREPKLELPESSPLIVGTNDLVHARLDHAAMLQKQIESALRLVSSNAPLYPAESLTPGYAMLAAGSPRAIEDAPAAWDTNAVEPRERFVAMVRAVAKHGLYQSRYEDAAGRLMDVGEGIDGLLARDKKLPQGAAAAVVRSFVTTVLDSAKSQADWTAFYNAFAPQIWVTDYQRAEQRSGSTAALRSIVVDINGALDGLNAPVGGAAETKGQL